MRIAVCDDQAEVLNTVERMFLEVGVITGIENVELNAILNSRMQELIPYVLNLVLHIYLRY